MKKISVFLVAFFIMLTNVNAATVVNQGNILDDNNQPFFVATDQAQISKYIWAKLATSDGRVAYCLDYGYNWPDSPTGIAYKDGFGSVDSGLIYILEHGAADYNNPTNRERYITQGAIWLYTTGSNTFSPEFTDQYNLLTEMRELVNAGKQAKSSGTGITNGTINGINASNTYLTKDGNYYKSSAITPSITGVSSYSVSAENATIVDATGNPKGTFNADESFYVKTSSDVDSVTAIVSINTKALAISPVNNSGYQRVITLGSENQTVTKSIVLTPAPVCVDYKIVGSVLPDPNLTDSTPNQSCYDKGTEYTQEPELTTRDNCKFNGWYTKEDLTDKWTDGTALNNDMTLYGSWKCAETVNVPSTAASTPLIILGTGLALVSGGLGYYIFKNKKLTI